MGCVTQLKLRQDATLEMGEALPLYWINLSSERFEDTLLSALRVMVFVMIGLIY